MAINIWIFCLERLDQRYTEQWFHNIPELLKQAIKTKNLEYDVHNVEGVQQATATTSGAFLNFTDTNFYKSSQLCNFVNLFNEGKVGKFDKILFTDFWNPCITQIAYMRDLMDQNWELHSIAHAGAYDPSDILGMKMSKPWPSEAERSWFYACDYTYFGTNFHKDMFLKNLEIPSNYHDKAVRSGQPHEYIVGDLESRKQADKVAQVIWPHRYNADKQPEIALDVSNTFPTIITQKLNLKKDEYYKEMSKCQVIFSCSLHENLGISIMEATLMGVIPVLPNRCSYTEMYEPEFLYPTDWTASHESYLKHQNELHAFIRHRLEHPELYQDALARQQQRLKNDYLNSSVMIDYIIAK